MVGTSHKSKQDGPAGSSHDDLASHGNEEHQTQPRSSAPITGYKHMRTKAVITRRKRPDDIISNENSNESQAADAGNKNVEGADVDQPPKAKRQKTGGTEGRRNRASPARLFKLNKDLVLTKRVSSSEKNLVAFWTLQRVACPEILASG
ncbi:hypothetical protein VPH35_122653 [Triticum aestivum]